MSESVGLLVLAVMGGVWAATAQAADEPHWEHCGWGAGGFYWSVAFHPSRDGVIYVGGDVGGAYKTEDHGRHWRFINRGLADYAVYALAVSPSAPDTVYAGTQSGLCKSADSGASWRFLEQTGRAALAITSERGRSVRNIAADPADADVLYAGTPDGRILKSMDGGESWALVHQVAEGGSVGAIAVSPDEPARVFAAAAAGMLLSADGGATWAAPETPKPARSVAVAAGGASVVYGAFGTEGVWKSTDGGQSWSAASDGIREGCDVTDVAVSPHDPAAVFCIARAGWDGFFYRSADGAATWELSNMLRRDLDSDPTLPEEFAWLPDGACPLSRPANLALSPLDPDELFIAGNWRLAWSDDAGHTWHQRDRGADITCTTDIRFAGGKVYVTAMDEGLLVTEDGGANWRQLCPRRYDPSLSGHQWRVLAWPGEGGDRIVSTCSLWERPVNCVLLSEDGGDSFQVVRQGLPDYRPTVNTMWEQSYPRALAADPTDPRVLYLGMDGAPEPAEGREGGGVFRSTDGGRSWQRLPGQPGSRRMFYGLAVDPTNPRRLYWGASAEGGGLYRSDDAGATWRRVFSQETWVFNVRVTSDGVVYCPGADLWKSTDHGETWERLSEFPQRRQIVGLEVDPADPDRIWLSRVTWGSAAVGDVYETTDGGATWHEITGDLPCRKPLVLRFNPDTRELWAGNVGLFRLKR